MTFNGRRGLNVSQYIANLNIPPATSPETFDDTFAQDDLNLFATAQFFDFDMGAGEEEELQKKKQQQQLKKQEQQKSQQNMSFMDTLNNFDFDYAAILNNIPEVAYTPQLATASTQHHPQQQQSQPTYSAIAPQPILPASSTSPATATSPDSHKRKASVFDGTPSGSNSPINFEDASRGAADEDKRRRNTAASARFRIKKKQREQAMENHARDLEDKCKKLDGRVNQLEMENKWLRSLITDKKDVVLPKKEDSDSSTETGKKGVGTAA